MSDIIDKKIESKINSSLSKKHRRKTLDDGFKKNKVINEVLDKPTVLLLYDLIKSQIISYVNGVVKSGKESVLFWAVSPEESDLALKIYLTSTSNFKNRSKYLIGDPRFSRIKKGTKNLVYLWAKKEFQNISKNVLIMEFVGNNGKPENNLLESNITDHDYRESLQIIDDLYNKANLVHGDFSEYNIFKTKKGLKLFDLGSAVDLEHPKATEFLKRDINNISNFFVKRGLTVENPIDVFERITK